MAEDLCYLSDVLYQVVEDVGQKNTPTCEGR